MNYDVNSLIRLLSYKEVYEAIKEFTFPYAIIKGEVLSILAYGKEGNRNSKDIDILIPREHIDRAKKILYAKGFEEIFSNRRERAFFLNFSHQMPPYIKKTKICRIFVDVNFDVFWGEYKDKRIEILEFMNDTTEMSVYGCPMRVLSPIKNLITIALHHYKDMNSLVLLATKKAIRYDMFKDIYYLIKRNSNAISVDQLYCYCDKYQIKQYVFYILFYTSKLFPDNILNMYIQKLQTDEGVYLLDKYGLCSEERKTWKCDFNERLNSDNLFELMKGDLTQKDVKKIVYNQRILSGGVVDEKNH